MLKYDIIISELFINQHFNLEKKMKTSNVVRNTFLYAIILVAFYVMFVGGAYFLCMFDGTQQYFLEFILDGTRLQEVFYVWFMMCISFFGGHVFADKSRNDRDREK